MPRASAAQAIMGDSQGFRERNTTRGGHWSRQAARDLSSFPKGEGGFAISILRANNIITIHNRAMLTSAGSENFAGLGKFSSLTLFFRGMEIPE